MRDEQYHTEQSTDGQTIQVANVGNPKGTMGVRSHICVACAMAFKEDKMTRYNGKWYGIPCGCHKDIPSLRRKERNQKIRSRIPEEIR